MNEWYSIADLVALNHVSLPKDKRGMLRFAEDGRWNLDPNRCREVNGNGGVRKEYHYTLLPALVQAHIINAAMIAEIAEHEVDERADLRSQSLWYRYQTAPAGSREKAEARLEIIHQLVKLRETQPDSYAMVLVEAKTGTPIRTLYRWLDLIAGERRSDWLAVLLPEFKGRTSKAECDRRAWDMLVSDYLRPAEPSFASCYARMKEAAEAHEWGPIPTKPTLKRRIESEIGMAAITMARKGQNAAAQLFPAQTRDKTVFHAMEATNADGHVFDVFVKYEDGTIGRPCLIGFQDVYSGMVLSHRISRTENKETTRLAILDMIESWGIPEHVYFDNGRAFMSKWITGGMKHRFRFKVKDEEPKGVLTQLGVTVHNVTPYHGQAKPIERAWRDMVDRISRHPALEGAFTGNNINAKPENYRSRAIPIEEFRAFVAQEIMRHNTRTDRNTQTAKGRSFAEVFKESLDRPEVVVQRASALQLQFCMLAGEGKAARRGNGEIYLADNRYWSEKLIAHAGRKLMVRFDPENLHDDLFVYTMDGVFIDRVPCIEAVGFNDAAAAREHARKKRQFMKAQRELLELGRLLTAAQVAAQIPDPDPIQIELPKVVGLNTSMPAPGELSNQDVGEAFGRGVAASLGVSSIFDHPSKN
ncbi:Mu transposase, C-terminal [Aliiroseovarius crassostreae]|uniref:Transposase n=1 Tax=Aliiroseovarius crassostreae TaxID=154981 RepID=A0A0N8IBX0_9RHOB|nr:transposase domain-containing protein [Aliiroseovarius crassostreae]KPN64283.1 hypothetical protein AKJ29_16755 [Aliiroseovarius crassostreae]SFU31626.1 Mu transposase, C-terminal [Aliiroseovarius crassostreae]